MVKINNIKIEDNGNFASCDFYPEQEEQGCRLIINLDNGEIVEFEKPSNSNLYVPMYVAHARNKLYEICTSKTPIPKEAYSVWY